MENIKSGVCDFAAEGYFDVFDDGSRREVEKVGDFDAGFEVDVMDHAGRLIVKMAVFAKIWAIAGGFTFEIDLADDAVLNECFKAVVNGGERDVGQAIFDTHEHIVGGRVIPLQHKSAIDLLALTRHSET